MRRSGHNHPIVIAHRGSSGTAPENTLTAFREAVEAGAQMIELDVRMTRDYELAVMHDRRVDRTTNGCGYVWDQTMAELRELDAGSWFSPRFRGEKVPSLRSVLGSLPFHVGVNIEVKTDGEPRTDTALAESLILLIRELRLERRAVVSSFDHRFLRRLHRSDPQILTGILYLSLRDLGRKPSALARATGAVTFVCSRAQLRRRFIADAHASGLRVACYTVNTLSQLRQMQRAGVDAVITNYPRRIIAALAGETPER